MSELGNFCKEIFLGLNKCVQKIAKKMHCSVYLILQICSHSLVLLYILKFYFEQIFYRVSTHFLTIVAFLKSFKVRKTVKLTNDLSSKLCASIHHKVTPFTGKSSNKIVSKRRAQMRVLFQRLHA